MNKNYLNMSINDFLIELDKKDREIERLKKKIAEMSENIKGIGFQNRNPSPHTCDICTSLNQEEEYGMWEEKRKIIRQIEKLQTDHPDQEFIMETPEGTVRLKIGDAMIYEGANGEIVFDSE